MVAKKWLPPDDYTLLAQFGVYRVYEFKHWQPDPFVITQGAGTVTVERFEAEDIRVHAAPGSHGKLRLNVSYFPRWHAYRDGKRVSLWPSALPEAANSTGFMTVWLEPGEYRFVFELSALDHVSLWLSVLASALCLAFVVSGRLQGGMPRTARALAAVGEWFERLSEARFRLARRIAGTALVLLGLLALIYISERPPPLVLENLGGTVIDKVRFDFLENLQSAHVAIEYPSRLRRCRRMVDRFACRNEDGNVDNEKYVASTPAEIEEYRMVRCIRARPEENARLDVFFPEVPTGNAIVGYFGIERAGRMLRLTRPVDFRIEVDGEPVLEQATLADNKMHWFRAPVAGPERSASVRFSVHALNVYKRFFCFYAQMADVHEDHEQAPATRRSVGEDDEEAH
jgi:uncharacterized protein YjeT (DUF2065 family)